MTPRELPALTIVRFFAALAVALGHYTLAALRDSPQWLQNIVSSGYVGVPFFFILSGFILVYVSQDRPLDSKQFWIRRVARIYPAYLLAWFLYGVIVLSLRGLSWHTFQFSMFFGALAAGLLQTWIPGAADKWNAPGWSLSCEAFFYLCFPLLFAKLNTARRAVLWGLLGASAVWCLARVNAVSSLGSESLASGSVFGTTAGLYIEQLPVVAIGLFVLGMTTGHLYVRGVSLDSRSWWPVSAIILLLMGIDHDASFLLIARDTWITLLFPLLVLSLAGVRLRDGRVKAVAVLLGQASYGMYVLQFPLWGLLWLMVDGGDGRAEKGLATALAFIAGLTIASCLVYLYFERPMENWIKHRFGQSKRPLTPPQKPAS